MSRFEVVLDDEIMEDNVRICIRDNYEGHCIYPFRYKSDNKVGADLICDKLNKLQNEIDDYQKLLQEIVRSVDWTITNEKNYGDEYVVEVLEDLKNEFNLDDKVKEVLGK